MPQIINTNISSLTAQRNLNTSQTSLATSLQRLSSGLRINSAKDDAAGMAIADRMTTQIRGLNQASRNANDAISLSQTAEGAMNTIGDNLQRIRELSVQSLNATNSASDRNALDSEVQQLKAEIDRVASQTTFNGVKLLDGSFQTQNFQVGANSGETIAISSITSLRTTALGTNFTATRTSANTLSALNAGDLTIQVGANIFSVGAAVNGTNGKSNDSAYSIANAINTASSGVTAVANATSTVSSAIVTTLNDAGTVTINGAVINIAALTGTVDTDGAYIAGQITASSALSGVTASYNSANDKLTLAAADGRNIVVGAPTGSLSNADLGTLAATTRSTFTMTATSDFTLAGTTPANAGLAAGTVTANAGGTALSNIDVKSVANSDIALATIDSALQTLNSTRGAMGAYQNRFASTVANLATTSENISAARSRIQDADFAAETALLTRNQILQQAGIAMLSQANSLPQNVLSLLK